MGPLIELECHHRIHLKKFHQLPSQYSFYQCILFQVLLEWIPRDTYWQVN